MGRSREYDETAVLAGAMHAFRRHGYGGVSVRDLEQATGLKAGSIYNSYRDKAGLFTAAFGHYNQAVLGRRIAEHAPEAAGLTGAGPVRVAAARAGRSVLRLPDHQLRRRVR